MQIYAVGILRGGRGGGELLGLKGNLFGIFAKLNLCFLLLK
jgi:hypothetical protein